MGRGGAERVISILSNHFAEKGWDVLIAVTLFNEVGYDLHPRVKIIDLTYNGGSRIERLPKWIYGIRKLVINENPDVILSFAARINIIVCTACIGLNKKIIVSERNDPANDGRGLFVRIATELFYPYTHKVIFQTMRSLKYFSERVRKNSTVIPNPIRVTSSAINIKTNKIVNVGRLTDQKNQSMLIEAFFEIHKVHPEYELWIYGEGPLRNKLNRMTTKLGINHKVHMPGNVVNIHENIADAEMFVLSSDYEGLSNALLEALMMGLPVISTNCSGADEYIQDNVSGIIVPIGNKDRLKDAILLYIENEEFRKTCGKNARKFSSKFELDKVLRTWEKILL